MLDILMVISIVLVIFGSLFVVYKSTMKINCKYSQSNIGKVVASFPVSYKMMGYIVRIGEKYYFCCEGCGITEVEYSSNLDKTLDNPSFQSMLAKQFGKINSKKQNKGA